MGKGENLGEFEQTVLITLARFDGAATAREIYTELVAVSGRDVSIAAVHVTLGRLESKGAVDVGAGPDEGGREVKHFRLTRAGVVELRKARAHWERLWEGVVLSPAKGS